MKVVTIHQPDFLPWLGFFHKMYQSDLFVVADEMQYVRDYYQQRVKLQDGAWLSLPVSAPFPSPIKDVVVNKGWKDKVVGRIKQVYGKYPLYAERSGDYLGMIDRFPDSDFPMLDLNVSLISLMANHLGFTKDMVLQSSIGASKEGTPSERLSAIVESVSGDCYLSGPNGKNYMVESEFSVPVCYRTYDPGNPYSALHHVFTHERTIVTLDWKRELHF